MEELPAAVSHAARGGAVSEHRAPRDLRQWIAAVEAIGQLRRIRVEDQ